MIEFNTDIEELKEIVRSNGEENNWNYTPNKLVRNVLIEDGNGKYKVVLVRYYNYSNAYYYTDEHGNDSAIKYIKKWCLID